MSLPGQDAIAEFRDFLAQHDLRVEHIVTDQIQRIRSPAKRKKTLGTSFVLTMGRRSAALAAPGTVTGRAVGRPKLREAPITRSTGASLSRRASATRRSLSACTSGLPPRLRKSGTRSAPMDSTQALIPMRAQRGSSHMERSLTASCSSFQSALRSAKAASGACRRSKPRATGHSSPAARLKVTSARSCCRDLALNPSSST